MARRPVVLVAPRWEAPVVEGSETIAPQEAIADCFVDAILAAGGLPLMMALTEDEGVIAEYVERADGIAVPGGPDVNPAIWGDEGPYDPALLCPQRDAFELPMLRAAVAADKPLLTTCRGTQLLNVALGGTLCMDVPSLGAREGMVQWRHTGILNGVSHPVEIEEGSLLSRVLGGATLVQANCPRESRSLTGASALASSGTPSIRGARWRQTSPCGRASSKRAARRLARALVRGWWPFARRGSSQLFFA